MVVDPAGCIAGDQGQDPGNASLRLYTADRLGQRFPAERGNRRALDGDRDEYDLTDLNATIANISDVVLDAENVVAEGVIVQVAFLTGPKLWI
jgi:hypothetical protein